MCIRDRLHDDPLDPQIGAPDLFHQLGVMAAFDPDPRPGGDLGAFSGDRHRATRGARLGPARLGELGICRGDRGREDDRHAVKQEPRPQREAAHPTAPILQVHDVHPTGLLDVDDGPDPAGLDFLDHEPGLGRDRLGPPARRATPVPGQHVAPVSVSTHGGESNPRAT